MKSSTKHEPKSLRDIAYYTQRYRNRVFAKLVSWINDQAQKHHLTQKDVAEIIRKDPAVISRLLNNPTNLTLDTISLLSLAFDAEAEPPDFVFFKDRPQPNYIHPLMAQALNVDNKPPPIGDVRSTTGAGQKTLKTQDHGMRIEFSASAGTG